LLFLRLDEPEVDELSLEATDDVLFLRLAGLTVEEVLLATADDDSSFVCSPSIPSQGRSLKSSEDSVCISSFNAGVDSPLSMGRSHMI
jgi:hypothetical protein